MPVMELSREPWDIWTNDTMIEMWRAEIFAHALYPDENDDENRKSWVMKVATEHAKHWTSTRCIMPEAVAAYKRWHQLLHLSTRSREIEDFKDNNNRDLCFAALIMIKCVSFCHSKASVIEEMAENMVIDGEANSLSAAKTVIKRAWRKYSPGCAHASAFFMRKRSGREPVALYESGKISLAEFDFLELSEIASGEHLRKLGEQMIPKHGNEPILDPERTWRVPD